jgi:(p)ppGpp synthase/HD superfamily hydrolase
MKNTFHGFHLPLPDYQILEGYIAMIYTELTKKSLRIAYDAHEGQVDRIGLPYIFHPYHLATQMSDEASICAAFLHDVVEDTEITFDDLIEQGISAEIVEAVRLLTHDETVPYMDYIRNIRDSGNPVAIAVKLADLCHNSDPTRMGDEGEKTVARRERYRAAMEILTAG